MARLATEADHMVGIYYNPKEQHHELIKSVLNCHESNVKKLTSKLSWFPNPFNEDTNELINLVTKAAKTRYDILWAQ